MAHNKLDPQLPQTADDSQACAQAQAGAPAEDPLAAIKNMRLAQLAVCRLKSQKQLQGKVGQSPSSPTGGEE